MANIYTSAEQLIGNTPLLELTGLERELNLKARLLAKLEFFNPAGSVKDRVAKSMLDDAAAQGKLTKDTVIIEPTSGNTGIGLASVAAARACGHYRHARNHVHRTAPADEGLRRGAGTFRRL